MNEASGYRPSGTAHDEVVVGLHGVINQLTTLHGTLRTWFHYERSQQAFAVARPRASTSRVYPAGVPPESREWLWEVWHAAGGRYRWDVKVDPDVAEGAGPPRLRADDGDRSYSVSDGRAYIRPSWTCEVIERLLDPSWVLTHDLDIRGETITSGRRALVVHAVARPHRTRSGRAEDMAGERDLVVDAERGFLHSDTALVNGEPYDVMELSDLALDLPIDPGLFTPMFPASVEVIDFTKPYPDSRARHLQWPLRWIGMRSRPFPYGKAGRAQADMI